MTWPQCTMAWSLIIPCYKVALLILEPCPLWSTVTWNILTASLRKPKYPDSQTLREPNWSRLCQKRTDISDELQNSPGDVVGVGREEPVFPGACHGQAAALGGGCGGTELRRDAVTRETSVMLPGAMSVPTAAPAAARSSAGFSGRVFFFPHLEVLDEHRDFKSFCQVC